MISAIIFIICACLFYSISIWTERIIKQLKPWIVILFSIGFCFDLTGTSMMFFRSTAHSISIHSICGYTALLIMLLHLFWAIFTLVKKGNYQKYFTRYSIWAWLIWMLAFISGVPKG